MSVVAPELEPPLLDEELPLPPDDDAPLDPLEELLDELDDDEPLELLDDDEPPELLEDDELLEPPEDEELGGAPDESSPPQPDINRITPTTIIELSKRRMTPLPIRVQRDPGSLSPSPWTRATIKSISTHTVNFAPTWRPRIFSINTSESFCENITRR